jgi:dTDP-4-dehydrorhamnose reductase
MLNLLITGATGMLGATLVNEFRDKFNVFATGNSDYKDSQVSYKMFDLRSESYSELIEWSSPDLIIHCAAITDSNFCENNPRDAFDLNGISVQKLLNSTEDNVKVIYISTDAVFHEATHLATEKDFVSPENVYGKSKEIGEFFLQSSTNRKYTIIRTTIVGYNILRQGKSFVEWIINSALKNQNIGLFEDVLFSPISIWHLAEEIRFIIENDIDCSTLHISGTSCSKYEFGKALLISLGLDENIVSPTSINTMNTRSNRSCDQTIDSTYYQKTFIRKLPSIKETIENIKIHYEINQTGR